LSEGTVRDSSVAVIRSAVVANRMPEAEDTVRIAACKTRAIYHIGLAVENRGDQFGVFGRIIFQIGVLNDNDVSGRSRETSL